MAKDPAFLFYSSDFLTGVQDLTMEERGQYITLLCVQHQKGPLSEKIIKLACGKISADVLEKFKKNSDGLYVNNRLEVEIEKRLIHTEKQRDRALSGWEKRKNGNATASATAKTTALPLENENEIQGNIGGVGEKEGKETFEKFRKLFPGTKRGLEIEWKGFIKHKDWREVVEQLSPRLQAEIADRADRKAKKAFVPEWPHLSTYINQRRWEAFEPENKPAPAEYKFDFSFTQEKDREKGLKQFSFMCYKRGFKNCEQRELEWAWDFLHPYGTVMGTWRENEYLTDRGLPGTIAEPNTIEQVLAHG